MIVHRPVVINRHNNNNDEWNFLPKSSFNLNHSLSFFLFSSFYVSIASNHCAQIHTQKYCGFKAHYKLLVCIAIYPMLCSICTINYIAWPSIPDTQRSSYSAKRTRAMLRLWPHSQTHYVTDFLFLVFFVVVLLVGLFVVSFFFSSMCFPSSRVLLFPANHFSSHMRVWWTIEDHIIMRIFFSSNKYIVTFFSAISGCCWWRATSYSIWFYEWKSIFTTTDIKLYGDDSIYIFFAVVVLVLLVNRLT